MSSIVWAGVKAHLPGGGLKDRWMYIGRGSSIENK